VASTPDQWNNDFGTAEALTILCSGSVSKTGSVNPAGTSDWFKVTYGSGCSLHVTIQSVGTGSYLARFDILDEHGVKLNYGGGGYELSKTLTTPTTVWVKVWSPYVTTPWILNMSVS